MVVWDRGYPRVNYLFLAVQFLERQGFDFHSNSVNIKWSMMPDMVYVVAEKPPVCYVETRRLSQTHKLFNEQIEDRNRS